MDTRDNKQSYPIITQLFYSGESSRERESEREPNISIIVKCEWVVCVNIPAGQRDWKYDEFIMNGVDRPFKCVNALQLDGNDWWMNQLMNYWITEWINELMNEWINQRMNGCDDNEINGRNAEIVSLKLDA